MINNTSCAKDLRDKDLMMAIFEGCQYHCAFCMYEHIKVTQPLHADTSMKVQDWYDLLAQAHKHGFRNLNIGVRQEKPLTQ